jgi:hypothetical protein
MATAKSRAARDDSLMDREAITDAFERAAEDYLTNNFSIGGLIGRLGGGESGKNQLVDLLGGKRETARRNVNRWLAYERGEAKQARKPGEANISRLHELFLKTVKRVKVSGGGTFTEYTGTRSSHRDLTGKADSPAGDRNAAPNFIDHMARGDTVGAWDAILDWYGVWPGALIPEPGEIELELTFE